MSIIIYDKDKKHKREENLALYTKEYLKRYYLSDELPKEHQYIKDRSGNLSEPQLGNKVKIDDEDIYIKLNDSSITLKELKAFLNKIVTICICFWKKSIVCNFNCYAFYFQLKLPFLKYTDKTIFLSLKKLTTSTSIAKRLQKPLKISKQFNFTHYD